ncbi:uncharacterized protein LOC120999211 [Bufo bufo]|uniref:uncharacterized protein LOC120999211 n=1 Tax=Bufo bufo TaxID=8384 RepID=UPI001ABE9873|nr:uncharacterized protein LOC120999211 [Bufo bufo]
MEGQRCAGRFDTWLASFMAPRPEDEQYWEAEGADGRTSAPCRRLLHMCDEILLQILDLLDPFSLLRVGGVCSTLYRVSSTDSLWAKHCRAAFGSGFRMGCAGCAPKQAFKLLYMWRKLYKTLPYNRQLQDLFFSGLLPKKYWVQWLTLEEIVPLPSVQLPGHEIEEIWGITKDLLDEKHKVAEESLEVVHDTVYKYEWKELHKMALLHHREYTNVQSYVLKRMSSEYCDLERHYCEYSTNRFQWLFSYWLFGLSKSCGKQLQRIYLWWQRFDKRIVSRWGSTDSDVKYLASLHYITDDFWNGKLANGDEHLGIQSVENYFSMCRSLLAWILGRKWGRFKQKKVYKDALEGVYRMLKHELQVSMVNHDKFWIAAKVQMSRICSLEKIAGNYVNWKIIDVLPCYRMFMSSGDSFYLEQIKGFLFRKQLINNWILQEENFWVSSLLPECLFQLLEYDTKIYEENLHGDTVGSHLSRLIWLYLHSGQQLYMDAIKGFVYECAYASYASQIYESVSLAAYVGILRF